MTDHELIAENKGLHKLQVEFDATVAVRLAQEGSKLYQDVVAQRARQTYPVQTGRLARA